MRDMANANRKPAPKPAAARRRLPRIRPWVQTAFLAVWLGPFGLRLNSVPGCVFHCYACPLASFACPVGLAAQFAALHIWPVLVLGVVVTVGALVGSFVCGWACPFGFLQDLLAKIPARKLRIPAWMGYGRYVVLAALVVAVPYFWGEGHVLFICRVCPAGALEAGVPHMIGQAVAGEPIAWMSWWKFAILGGLVVAAIFSFRPWCTALCPLGGFLSLFNRGSLLHMRFDPVGCTECNLCRSRCPAGVKVETDINSSRCIRCTECTVCGAIRVSTVLSGEAEPTDSTP